LTQAGSWLLHRQIRLFSVEGLAKLPFTSIVILGAAKNLRISEGLRSFAALRMTGKPVLQKAQAEMLVSRPASSFKKYSGIMEC
jgi:hypothetical protein